MSVLECLHDEPSRTKKVCSHLLNASSKYVQYVQRFTGDGRDYDLLCRRCGERPEKADLRRVCSLCFEKVADEGSWEGIIGAPQILHRETGVYFRHRTLTIPNVSEGTLLAIHPVCEQPHTWLALTTDGDILRLNLAGQSADLAARVPDKALLTSPMAMHVSPGGTMVAILQKRGPKGVVLDLMTGKATMGLERGDYHVEHYDFSCAFFELNEKLYLVHATDWNRLDVSCPHSGRCLTARNPTSLSEGQSSRSIIWTTFMPACRFPQTSRGWRIMVGSGNQ